MPRRSSAVLPLHQRIRGTAEPGTYHATASTHAVQGSPERLPTTTQRHKATVPTAGTTPPLAKR